MHLILVCAPSWLLQSLDDRCLDVGQEQADATTATVAVQDVLGEQSARRWITGRIRAQPVIK
jgi:hypothetical protein